MGTLFYAVLDAKRRGFRHFFALMGRRASHFDDAVPLGTVDISYLLYP